MNIGVSCIIPDPVFRQAEKVGINGVAISSVG
jgi:hypothetical protein